MASFKQLPPEFRYYEDERRGRRKGAGKATSAKARGIAKSTEEKKKPKTVDQDAMDTTKLLKEEGVENVMNRLGGKKQPDGSYVFKSTGGLINGRPTGKGEGAARSV